MKKTINKLNVSGLRGLVGEEITPELLTIIIKSFIDTNGIGKYCLAYDTRNTSPHYFELIKSIFILSGCDVVELGIIPTPTLLFSVNQLNAIGGVMITASHNPMQYNALKLVKKGGYFLNNDEAINVRKRANELITKNSNYPKYNKIGKSEIIVNIVEQHIAKLKTVFDFDKIRNSNLKVALDLCNGTAIYAIPQLLDKLGVSYDSIFDEKDKAFEREPEPNQNTMQHLSKFMKNKDYNVGFIFDPDADRVAVVLRNGQIISEEFTLVFSYYNYCKNYNKKDIVVNLSSSSMTNRIAEEFNRKVIHAPVGEINVTNRMIDKKVEIGGEGNGGVIYFPISNSRDTLVGVTFILDLLANNESILNNIYDKYNNLIMRKDKYNLENDFDKEDFYNKVENNITSNFKYKTINKEDGVRIDFENGFLHIRTSNTEPVFRYIREGNEDFLNKLDSFINKNFL